MMNTTDYEYIWRKSLIHVTDEFALPPVVLQAGEAIIGTLGNFSVSTGKAKAKKTFNVSAIVAAALVNGQVLEYKASFPESKRTILYFDTEQSPYHCQLEKPCNFDPFGQTGFAPVGHNIFDPCKVLAQGSILFYPFRYSGFSLPLTYACSHRIILWYAPYG